MDLDLRAHPKLKPFLAHGISFNGERGDNVYGDCPFTDKPDKFYVNKKSGLWDSKTAGISGNIPQFLAHLHAHYLETETDEMILRELAEHRSLPLAAIKAWNIAYNGTEYLLPILDPSGVFTDLRRYSPSKKLLMSTAGMHAGLFGAHRLPKRASEPVYLCEGEWDAIAMHYLLRKNKAPGVALGVPGAGTFKPEWSQWLAGRTTHTLYDHDTAGRNGEDIALKRLKSSVQKLTFVHWPEDLPVGWDTRDWVTYGINKGTLDLCLSRLHRLFRSVPRSAAADMPKQDVERSLQDQEIAKRVRAHRKARPTLDDVHVTFHRWLKLDNSDAIDLTLATYISQHLTGLPIWLFLVGPPSSAKTVIIDSLRDHKDAYLTSTLTPPALISGATSSTNGGDPSLIPRLNEKTLLVKDFTVVLSMRQIDRDEIFSILRDAYDGRCGKVFGNGVERNYESKFTMIAGVTPDIHRLGSDHAALGERFVKFSIADNLVRTHEHAIIQRTIENIDHDTEMNLELRQVMTDFLEQSIVLPENPKAWPQIRDNRLVHRVVQLARYCALMRGVVSRDRYSGTMTGKPFVEVGARIGGQIAKLMRSLALLRGHTDVQIRDYQLVRKVVRDTISQRNEELLQACWRSPVPTTRARLSELTHYNRNTVSAVMEDLELLGVVERHKPPKDAPAEKAGPKAETFTVSDMMTRVIEESGIYDPDLAEPEPALAPSPRKRRFRLMGAGTS